MCFNKTKILDLILVNTEKCNFEFSVRKEKELKLDYYTSVISVCVIEIMQKCV